ncbi:phage terminase large subunit family protein [Pleomorphomonas sp. NRK KF1]|uniref:phage terminase large subunit family protein n=1 Tax=Pleomorphomonas sp. NRK KF1 TaxID=2943000 RepID=UPI002043FDD2|nr:phage terminase large subunit family protein [Pleomorphomonas sp. NRK KF1]MCM5552410.1 phage terminase large subunit family protein [Pleomorphomonas sp. NRK KF1]
MEDLALEARAFVDAVWRRGLEPEPQLTVSEWSDRHRLLPQASAEPGPWRTARVPYLRAVMDALSASSAIERVVFMAGAQVGKTEAGLNWLGYVIAHAPGMMLLVQPTIDMVRRNSRTRIDPLIEETPALRGLVAPPKAREKGNTIAQKEFLGGSLIMTGANAPTGLRSTPARYLFLDEVDAFPVDAAGEGDPIDLAIRRTATFRGRRKIYLCSTPTLAGVSRIEKAYLESDQRRFFVPCPQCGEAQPITWDRIQWPEGEPDRAHLVCSACGGVAEERHKPAMLAAGEWRATAEGDGRTAGFHLPGLYSPFETWGEMARDFLDVKDDPPRLQAWVNTRLGEPFEDRATTPILADDLMARAEEWGDRLPAGVLAITAGVDTQDNRLEVELVAWGAQEESWSLGYEVLWGDPAKPEVWTQLDQVLAQRFPIEGSDQVLAVAATAIDSGGHRTAEVVRFAQGRANRRVWAIKGRGGPGVPPWPKRPPKLKAGSPAPVFIVGVDTLKAALYARLRLDGTGPGRLHFPSDRDLDWYRGLTAERPIRKFHKGVAKIEWIAESGVRNEPLDCRVYATAALHGLYATGYRLDAVASATGGSTPRIVIKSKWLHL